MSTLVVVGRTGSGKSSVGNSILGKCIFSPRKTTEKARLSNERGSSDEYIVVDCSGIGDTGNDMAGDMKAVIKSALDGVLLCCKGKEGFETHSGQLRPCEGNHKSQEGNSLNDAKNDFLPTNSEVEHIIQSQQIFTSATENFTDSNEVRKCGFDALIFVIKFGARFTKQEKDSVDMVKSIFGDNVFKDWGIIVFSYGDNFYNLDDDVTFEDWCRQQTGDIKTLFEEVDYRCVIFDNKYKNEEAQILQYNLLEQHIKTIVNKRRQQYTRVDFVGAHVGQGKLLSKEEFEEIQREVTRLIEESNVLVDEMAEIQVELQAKMGKIRESQSELQSQEEKIDSKDQGTELLEDLNTRVKLQKQKLETVMGHTCVSTDDVGQQMATAEQVEAQGHGDSEGMKSALCLWRRCICCYYKPQYKQFDETNTTIN